MKVDNAIAFEMVRGLAGLESLEAVWRELAGRMGRGRAFYHDYEWFHSRMACGIDGKAEPIFVTARLPDGVPVAIFPLQPARIKKGGLTLRSLQVYWPDDMDVNDCIIDVSRVDVDLIRLLLDFLRQQAGIPFHLLELQNVPESGAISSLMKSSACPLTLSVCVHCSKYVTLGETYEETTGSISGKFKRNLRRKAKKLEKFGHIGYNAHHGIEGTMKAFETFLEVEANSWKGSSGTGTALILDESKTRFYRELVSRFAHSGRLCIDIMTVSGKPVAAQLGVISGDTLHLLKIAYDQAWGDTGPGGLLLKHTLDRFSGHPEIRNISFVTGARWNDDWAPQVNVVHTRSVFRATLPGLCGYVLAHTRQLLIRIKHHYKGCGDVRKASHGVEFREADVSEQSAA
jgi:CelD/BcsL family acetyltransferase involved in cellulose biosynthesis